LSNTLGRLTGYFLIERYGPKLHIKMKRVARIHAWFLRFGRFTLTFGYYVPGVRHLTAYVAGASELEFAPFALFAYSGAAIWSTTFVLLGYFFGDQWSRVTEDAQKYITVAVAGLAVLAGAFLLLRKRRRPRGRHT
jgi:LPXTG-motif cell wall-anchored protein